MKHFKLVQPATFEAAVEQLPFNHEAERRPRVLAGGQDLLGELKDHLIETTALVDLKTVPGMDSLEVTDAGVKIGALVTVATLERSAELRERFPILAEAAEAVASPQIRTRATLGGNLCQRPRCWYYRNEHTVCLKKGGTECFSVDGRNKYSAIFGGGPSHIVHPSDLAPALVALDAVVTVRGRAAEWTSPLADFFTLPTDGDVTRENLLATDEIVTGVEVPAHDGWRSTYVKFRERGTFDWALASVALALRVEGERIVEARLVLGGVAPTPWRCRSTEAMLEGRELSDETFRAAANDALAGAKPLRENGYKVPLAKGLIIRALRRLA